ncbi:MAG: sulfatase [Planctomycetes bacterium]|nr:sulfatase [Planctomycetota bacterium]
MRQFAAFSCPGLLAVAFAVVLPAQAPSGTPRDAAPSHVPASPASGKRLNVLFLAVDDLRPALGCYGDPVAITPCIDRLAARGTIFRRAYCQQALCSPSRLSLMTGRRPDTTRVWDLDTHFRAAMPDVVTLPQHFRQNGYFTRSFGKIYHGGGPAAKDPPSWSAKPRFDTGDPRRYVTPANLASTGAKRASTERGDVDEDGYTDGMICAAAIAELEQLAQRGDAEPFFLAVGFHKPHLPFCAPAKYWDLYDRDAIPLPDPATAPADAPEYAMRSWRELEGYTDIADDGAIPVEQIRTLRHGYYACVSYADALVGRLLDALARVGHSDDTVVVLWGDHGYHLGEQSLWTKANNFELSVRVPLIVALPTAAGAVARTGPTDALVELVDLYPSLAELCGLPAPDGVEGTSFVPLLADPERPWKRAVFHQFPRAPEGRNRHRGRGAVMGYAARTDRYRYVEWRDSASGEVAARELYDQAEDPRETVNLAGSAAHADAVAELAERLRAGWRAAVPAGR